MATITVMVFEDVNDKVVEHIKELARFTPQIEDVEPSTDSVTLGILKLALAGAKYSAMMTQSR